MKHLRWNNCNKQPFPESRSPGQLAQHQQCPGKIQHIMLVSIICLLGWSQVHVSVYLQACPVNSEVFQWNPLEHDPIINWNWVETHHIPFFQYSTLKKYAFGRCPSILLNVWWLSKIPQFPQSQRDPHLKAFPKAGCQHYRDCVHIDMDPASRHWLLLNG